MTGEWVTLLVEGLFFLWPPPALLAVGVVPSRFMAWSKAEGRSWAPGGTVFLLGLPWGVLVGSMKLLCLLPGVEGRAGMSAALEAPGKKLDMKLAIVGARGARRVAGLLLLLLLLAQLGRA